MSRGPAPGGTKRKQARKDLLTNAINSLRDQPMTSDQLAVALSVCDSSGRRFMGLMSKAEAVIHHSYTRAGSRKVVVWQLGEEDKVQAYLAEVQAGAFPSPSPAKNRDFTPRSSIVDYQHDPILLHLFAGRWPAVEQRV